MTVHPGAFCAPLGAEGVTNKNTPMVCRVGKGTRARWGRDPRPVEAREVTEVAAKPAAVAAKPAPITYRMSDKPLAKNTWGTFASDPVVNFHDDGEIGQAIKRMGPDAHLDVDGDALANVLGRLVTDAVVGRSTSQDVLDQVKQIHDRLPESNAKFQLGSAVARLDAADTAPPEVPDGTPSALAQLVTDLHAVPLVRRDPSKEEQPLMDLIGDVVEGRTGGFRLLRELGWLENRRHESVEGKQEIDRAIGRARQALEDERRNRRRPSAG